MFNSTTAIAVFPAALVAVILTTGCEGPTAETDSPTAAPTETPEVIESSVADSADPVFEDVPSPVGGTVKQVTIPGPEISVLVACDQTGFEPFFFTDQGDWVGCQIMDGAEPGPESALTEPTMDDVASPVGGTVKQVTIPGPDLSVMVICGAVGFQPFFFIDQGAWVGCEGT